MDDNETRVVEEFAQWLMSTYYVYETPQDVVDECEADVSEAVQRYARYCEVEAARLVEVGVQP